MNERPKYRIVSEAGKFYVQEWRRVGFLWWKRWEWRYVKCEYFDFYGIMGPFLYEVDTLEEAQSDVARWIKKWEMSQQPFRVIQEVAG